MSSKNLGGRYGAYMALGLLPLWYKHALIAPFVNLVSMN